MPMYTLVCRECEIQEVRMIKIADRDSQECEMCKVSMQRMIDRPGGVYAPTASSGGTLKV